MGDKINFVGDCAFDDTQWYDNLSDGLIYIGNVVYAYKGKLNENDEIWLQAKTTAIASGAFDSQKLSKIYIPDSVTYIGNVAFRNCDNLSEIALPSKLSYIGTSAFNGCTEINEFNLSKEIQYVGHDAFSNTAWYYNQPNGIVYIGNVAYSVKGNDLQNNNIVLNNGTKIIAEHCFSHSNIESVAIPKGVINICNYAFAYCEKLSSVTLSEGIESIGKNAFYNCSGIIKIKLPDSIKYIGDYAFGNCTGITEINIPNKLTQINKYTFKGCTIKRLIIPNNVNNILSFAFSECNIEEVFIPHSVKYIESYAFDNVKNFKNIYYNGTYEEWTDIKNRIKGNFCYEFRKAKLNCKLNSIGLISDKVNIYKYADDDIINITGLRNNNCFYDLSQLTLYIAEYDRNKDLITISNSKPIISNNVLYFTANIPESKTYKMFLWDNNLNPVILPITD